MKILLAVTAFLLSLFTIKTYIIDEYEFSKNNSKQQLVEVDDGEKINIREVKTYTSNNPEYPNQAKWFIINYQSLPKDIKNIN